MLMTMDTSDSPWTALRKPRIRQITGIQIHQLTLPAALALSAQVRPESSDVDRSTETPGYRVGESSIASASTSTSATDSSPTLRRTPSSSSYATLHPSRRDRRASISHPQSRLRQRSSSSSIMTLSTALPGRQGRVTRPRAPTLAGEAMEARDTGRATHVSGVGEEDQALVEARKRSLVRSFVVLRMPPRPADPPPIRPRSNSHSSLRSTMSVDSTRQGIRGGSRSSLAVPKTLRRPDSIEQLSRKARAACGASEETSPTFSTHQSASAAAALRAIQHGRPHAAGGSPAVETPTVTRLEPLAMKRSSGPHASKTASTAPDVPISKSPRSGKESSPVAGMVAQSQTAAAPPPPFFISSIHHPSTQPRWMHLTAESDFAPWLPVEDAASTRLMVEIWCQDAEKGWTRLTGSNRMIDLCELRRASDKVDLPDNALEFTLEGEKGLWYLPAPGVDGALPNDDSRESAESANREISAQQEHHRQRVNGIVEKSMRETRMKKGTGIGAIHRLVNIQAVIADTEREIAEVQSKIDALLQQDVDRRAFRRDLHERADKCRWIRDAISAVEENVRSVEAKIEIRSNNLEERQSCLLAAEEADEVVRGRAHELQEEISTSESDRAALVPAIHHLRSVHAQTLDFIFPIQPLDASALLYSILDVPLPIPAGPRDPAPPLSLPPASLPEGIKIDERTVSAALGYVALVVQLLGSLAGPAGCLPYPITCAGSKSIVKDVVSVMQGPRAFPLYAKGVERYRYEYAVFLLNKDIESLAQDSRARIMDIRHTLPNVKSLLLTLSSPAPPEPIQPPVSAVDSSNTAYVDSRASSRYPSKSWAMPVRSPGSEPSVQDTDTLAGSPATLARDTVRSMM